MSAPDITDYTGLITSEHADKPKFMAMIAALTQWAVDERTVTLAFPGLFDVDVAVGQQLNFCGLWVGAPRLITIQPNVLYPSPAEPYQFSLDDDTYRRFIYAKILANSWDGTPDGIVPIYQAFWGSTGGASAELDLQDMSILLYLVGPPGGPPRLPLPEEIAIITQFLVPVRASGVLLNGFWVAPGPLFGLDIENHFIAGPDVGYFGTFISGP